jgi:membrane protease subunit (stomatin/prohibitin family)
MDLSNFIGKKTPDEIERAIVKALTDAGRTTHGREWYTPTAIGVHSLAWAARAANGLGQAQIAGICALLYGMLDIFGFSGSVRLAMSARNQMQQKMAQPQPKKNADTTTSPSDSQSGCTQKEN